MTNIYRALKLLGDIKAVDEESGVGLILAYAMEIRRETEMAYCNDVLRSTKYLLWSSNTGRSKPDTGLYLLEAKNE
jgi:hypothetical protein